MLDYWEESVVFKKAKRLPKTFSREVYISMNKWFGSQPKVNLPHV